MTPTQEIYSSQSGLKKVIDRTIGLGPSVLQLSDLRIDALDLAERLGGLVLLRKHGQVS